ncbi:unnamed protein product, partial [Urochloa humidicola]
KREELEARIAQMAQEAERQRQEQWTQMCQYMQSMAQQMGCPVPTPPPMPFAPPPPTLSPYPASAASNEVQNSPQEDELATRLCRNLFTPHPPPPT